MRYKEHKHESETKHSSLFVLSFLGSIPLRAALGTPGTLWTLSEHRISETARI